MARRTFLAAVVLAGCLFPDPSGLGGDAGDAGDAGGYEASVDAPSEASAVGCAEAGVVLCEDFEQPLDPTVWTQYGSGTLAPVLDTSRAHSGSTSMRLTTTAVPDGGSVNVGISESASFTNAQVAAGFYTRAWLYVPSTDAFTTSMTIVDTQQSNAPYQGTNLQIRSGFQLQLVDYTGSGGFNQAASPIPLDTWVCVEWQVAYGTTTGSLMLWVNGSPLAALTNVDTLSSPPYSKLHIQASFYQVSVPQPAITFWVDDFMLDSQRIGCSK